ncbi:MAG: hypothetical protein U1F35_10125 [Steroidobacteraceae bacterium]
MKKGWMVMMVVAAGLALSGCPKRLTVKDVSGSTSQAPADAGGSTSADSAQTSATPFGDSAAGPAALAAALAGKIIYFDYDKVEIKAEYAGIITAVART